MNTKKYIKVGNIFEFSEDRLIAKIKRGDIDTYSVSDIIEGAIKVRKYMDKNPEGLKIPNVTPEERRIKDLKAKRQGYYLTK
jgi:hypothetical protein